MIFPRCFAYMHVHVHMHVHNLTGLSLFFFEGEGGLRLAFAVGYWAIITIDPAMITEATMRFMSQT